MDALPAVGRKRRWPRCLSYINPYGRAEIRSESRRPVWTSACSISPVLANEAEEDDLGLKSKPVPVFRLPLATILNEAWSASPPRLIRAQVTVSPESWSVVESVPSAVRLGWFSGAP